jgi:hypothetical protein
VVKSSVHKMVVNKIVKMRYLNIDVIALVFGIVLYVTLKCYIFNIYNN